MEMASSRIGIETSATRLAAASRPLRSSARPASGLALMRSQGFRNGDRCAAHSFAGAAPAGPIIGRASD
jgi:hypothetical protein